METPYDWATVALFAVIIVIFLQRSIDQERETDSILSYMPPSVGCAVANYFGNQAIETGNTAYHVLGIGLVLGVVAYIYYVLKPLRRA